MNESMKHNLCELINKLPNEQKIIKKISEFLIFYYLKKGVFCLNTKKEVHNNELTSNLYEKNNNLLIDFQNDEKNAILFMNNTKELKNLNENNIYTVNYKNYKNKIYLFSNIMSFNEGKKLLANIEENLISPIWNYKNKRNKSAIHSTNNNPRINKITNDHKNIQYENNIFKKNMEENQSKKNIFEQKMTRQKSAANKISKNPNELNIPNYKNKQPINTIDKKILKILIEENIPKNKNNSKKQKLNNNTKSNMNDNNIGIYQDRNINKINMQDFNNNKIINKIQRINDIKTENIQENKLSEVIMQNNLYKNENNNLKLENIKLKELKNNLINSKLKIDELNNELNDKKKQLEEKIRSNNEQKSKLKELEISNGNNRIKINNLNEEINQKNKEIEKLKNEIDELKKKITKIVENYEQKFNVKNEELKILQEKIDNLGIQIKIYEENNIKKEKEIQTKNKTLENLNIEINQLKNKINIKNKEIDELKEKLKESQELIDKLKSDNNNNELFKNKYKSQIIIENNSINHTESNFSTKEKYNLNNKKRRNTNKIEIIAKDIENKNEIKDLEEKTEKYKKIISDNEIELQSLRNEIIKLKDSLNTLIKENNELKNKENELKDNIKILNQKEIEISNLKSLNKELQKKNEKQSKLLKEYESKINQQINDIENYDKSIDKLTKQIKEYQKNDIRNQNLLNKEKQLNLKENEINKKQKQLNDRILFLENKENLLNKQIKESEKEKLQIQNYLQLNNQIKNENENLKKMNQNLEYQILNYKQMISNFSNLNNQQNNIGMIPINQNIILPQNNQQNNIIMNFNNQLINNCNNNNNKEKKNKIELEPIKLYSKPTLIGLNNIGATCFMNSTLQCLSQTEQLTNYFLKVKNKNKIINNNIAKINPNEYQLSPVYLELIQKLWEINGPKSFSPFNFMNRINDMNPLFKKGQAGDAKDFIIFVLEQMHKELKMPVKTNKQSNINDIPLNQYDKMNALNHFFEEFKNETSILTDTFFGFNETTNICLYCKNDYNSKGMTNPICYNYGVFNVLIFPLEEVKNMKNNSLKQNNNNNQNDLVTLNECFIYNQKTDFFTGENKNYCNICKQLYESHYTSKIYISPNVLIIILNRGKDNIYKVKLDFQPVIDITNFVIQKEMPKIQYNLFAVITHLGESGPNAHFVATCKSPVDGIWYRYNDAFVNPINDFQKDIYDFGNPYILFYQKIK